MSSKNKACTDTPTAGGPGNAPLHRGSLYNKYGPISVVVSMRAACCMSFSPRSEWHTKIELYSSTAPPSRLHVEICRSTGLCKRQAHPPPPLVSVSSDLVEFLLLRGIAGNTFAQLSATKDVSIFIYQWGWTQHPAALDRPKLQFNSPCSSLPSTDFTASRD